MVRRWDVPAWTLMIVVPILTMIAEIPAINRSDHPLSFTAICFGVKIIGGAICWRVLSFFDRKRK